MAGTGGTIAETTLVSLVKLLIYSLIRARIILASIFATVVARKYLCSQQYSILRSFIDHPLFLLGGKEAKVPQVDCQGIQNRDELLFPLLQVLTIKDAASSFVIRYSVAKFSAFLTQRNDEVHFIKLKL